MSKAELKPQAKDLYVVHQLSLSEIGRRLNISTRTLQTWKAEDHWELERAKISGSQDKFHAEIFELGEVLARQIKQDLQNGVAVDNARFTSLQRIIDTAETSRKYEEKAPKKKNDERTPEERQKAALKKLQEVLGI